MKCILYFFSLFLIVLCILFSLSLSLFRSPINPSATVFYISGLLRLDLDTMVGYDPKKKDLTNPQILIASSTSGFVARFLLQPIDVIKIRFQVGQCPGETSRELDALVCCNLHLCL